MIVYIRAIHKIFYQRTFPVARFPADLTPVTKFSKSGYLNQNPGMDLDIAIFTWIDPVPKLRTPTIPAQGRSPPQVADPADTPQCPHTPDAFVDFRSPLSSSILAHPITLNQKNGI